MTLRSSSSPRTKANRNRPALEGLEERKLLSRALWVLPLRQVLRTGCSPRTIASSPTPLPPAATPTIQVVGLGNLVGTT